MPDTMHEVILRYPPREVDPIERELLNDWLGRAGDVSTVYVSGRKSDDPALYRRIVIVSGSGDQPTHLIHAPDGLHLWVKLTIGPYAQVQLFDSLRTALNSIRHVLA